MNKAKVIILLIFLLGAGVRAVDLWRPVDGSIREPWREADIASIARNYYREDMNIFYPRIDWNADGPGYAEMEFPIYPWLIAVLYKYIGFNEVIGRVLSYIFSLIAMGIFFLLSRYLLKDWGALAGLLFFALSPLAVRISNSLQPEAFMFTACILASYAFIRWIEEKSWKYYFIALVSTASAILFKMNAAHLGIFFASILIAKNGLRSIRSFRVWIFAIGSLLPGILWFIHAHRFWTNYGNSLGVSNEYHWVGVDFITNPYFIRGIIHSELSHVWMYTGIIVVLTGMFIRRKEKAATYILYWIISIFVYYTTIARTAADEWALYYHVISVPPFALLFGLSFDALKQDLSEKQRIKLILIPIVLATAMIGMLGFEIYNMGKAETAMLIFVAAGVITISFSSANGKYGEMVGARGNRLVSKLLIFLITATFLLQALKITKEFRPRMIWGMFECAEQFHPYIPEKAMILVSGGACKDESGYPIAFNASYFFYWLDRKGFNLCEEEQTIENVKKYERRGAEYFIGEKERLNIMKNFENRLRTEFEVVGECGGKAMLFRLDNGEAIRVNK